MSTVSCREPLFHRIIRTSYESDLFVTSVVFQVPFSLFTVNVTFKIVSVIKKFAESVVRTTILSGKFIKM